MVAQSSHPGDGLGDLHQDGAGINPAWASEAPLKLVASVLDTMPDRTGKVRDIREALEAQVVLNPKWDTWWTKRVRPALIDSEHFKAGKNNSFILLRDVEDVPAEPLQAVCGSEKAKTPKKERARKEKAPSKLELEWLEWFQSEAAGLPPTRGRTKEAVNALDKCDAGAVGRALHRMTESRYVLDSTKQAAGAWAKLVSQAATRWRADVEAYADDDLAESTGHALARLVEVANFPQDAGRWLRQAGGLPDGQPEPWRNAFAAGIWKAVGSSSDGARDWFRSSFHRSAYEDRVAIAREISLAAFVSSCSAIQHVQVDRLLDFLSIKDESEFIHELIVRSASGKAPKQSVLDYVDRKSQSIIPPGPVERLSPLVLATLLLTDGQGAVVDRASQQIGEALEGSSLAGTSVWSGLMAGGWQRIADLREQQATELERQRLSYESKLEELRREEERLNDTVQRLRAEIAAGREVARMDILQDILTVITETLQSLRHRQESPEQMLRRVEANLTLALRSGGAEEFGTIDDTVPYDPIQHQAEQYVPSGSSVRIVVPGALLPGKLAGDRVLLKAGVVFPAGVK